MSETVRPADLAAATAVWEALPKEDRPPYYDEVLFPLIVEQARARYRQRGVARDDEVPYDILFLTCGFSPWPLALTLRVVPWREAYVLHTAQTRTHYDHVVTLLRAQGHESTPQRVDVAEGSAVGVYRGIHDHLPDEIEGLRIGVDCTGGTKSMVAGASLVAALLGADLLYVETEFDPQLRAPRPGSEHLVLLDNPYEVFGDPAEREARQLAAAGDWAAAARRLAALADRVTRPERRQHLDLAAAYRAWDELDFTPAAERLETLIEATRSAKQQLAAAPYAERVDTLGQQAAACRSLAGSLGSGKAGLELLGDTDAFRHLWGWLRAYGERRFAAGQYDLAALIDYRTVELMSQRRLALHGLDSAQPDWSRVELTDAALSDAARTMYGKDAHKGLAAVPAGPLALRDGLQVLLALDDAWVADADRGAWPRLLGQLDSRNLGLFAHGFNQTDRDRAAKFNATVAHWCERFCTAEAWPPPDPVIEPYRFVPLA